MHIVSEAISIEISYALLLFIAFIGAYKLISYLFADPKIGVIGSLFYGYSIYGQFMSAWPIHSGAGVFALAPYFAYIFLKIKKGDSVIHTAAKLGILTIFFVNVNLTFIIYLFAFLFAIIVFRYFCEAKQNFRTSIAIYFLTIILYILINSPFIIIYLTSIFIKSNVFSVSLAAESVGWKSSTSYLHELIREMGALNFYFSFKNIIAYPNAQIFVSNSFFIITSYLISFLIYIAFLLKSGKSYYEKLKLFILFILIVSFFFGMGVFPLSPTRGLYSFFGNVIPFFAIFRDSYKVMFIINMLYAILLAYILYVCKVKRTKWYKNISVVVIVILVINSFQFWSGNFLNHQVITIPNKWYEVYNTEKESQDDLTLFMPNIQFPVYNYTAQRGIATFFYRPLFNYSVVNSYDIVASAESTTFSMIYKSFSSQHFQNILGFYGIDSVLLQKDIDWRYYEQLDPSVIQKDLDRNLIKRIIYK